MDQEMEAVNRRIGARLLQRRRQLHMTQAELASAVGVTFQQIHKYETGHNSMSAARLWAIAKVLDARPDFFFPEDPPEPPDELAA